MARYGGNHIVLTRSKFFASQILNREIGKTKSIFTSR